ncbi:carnitine O-acetyltransferase yat1 [Cryptotrichosporon argae]
MPDTPAQPLVPSSGTTHDPSRSAAQSAAQPSLPKLPVPKLQDTCKRYLRALEGLQDEDEHERTKKAVDEFLSSGEGETWQKKLEDYAAGVDSYIEEFWYESYLSHSESVVLSLNPFFVLSSDVTPRVDPQLSRAASLILSSLLFIHDLRNGELPPDTVRGTPLDMSQYQRLFATCRVPTDRGCRMEVHDSRHIVVLRRGQFYWFDVLDDAHRPILSDKEIFRNLQAIVSDADKTPVLSVAQNAIGILTTENRKIWSHLRDELVRSNKNNAGCLAVVESALFVVCLDDEAPPGLAELCSNFLCGGYKLEAGVQVGTCTNRWYDKLQIIVCPDGEAGINFEHTGVDGHTVLRYAADVYTELVLLYAKTINPSTPSLFKVKPPSKPQPGTDAPKKLEWRLTPDLRAGVRYAETRISDLICQNDSQALEFRGYGGNFIKRHGFSPDAFVQMAFQAAYYGLYGMSRCNDGHLLTPGRVESTYEPAMTKAYLHGRTEAIRTVQPESVKFVKTFCSETATAGEKVAALRDACKRHTALTKECSAGMGQDRHLYALYSLVQREIQDGARDTKVPSIFTDPGYNLLGTSVLSTSNCGNPALRLFGFGPVTPEGYGIGYIIKDDGISVCMSSKHLQTRRLLNTLQAYLFEIRALLVQLWREANERPAAFMDHTGVLRDARTGNALSADELEEHGDEEELLGGFGFFDVGANEVTPQARRRRPAIGKTLSIAEY